MALSMDEQRILAEIERRLADDDPGLNMRLSTFGRRRLSRCARLALGIAVTGFTIAMIAVLTLASRTVGDPRVRPSAPGPRPAQIVSPRAVPPDAVRTTPPVMRAPAPDRVVSGP